MNQDELQERILMFNHLEQQESKPAAPYDPSEGMNEPELRDFVRFLYGDGSDSAADLQYASGLRHHAARRHGGQRADADPAEHPADFPCT